MTPAPLSAVRLTATITRVVVDHDDQTTRVRLNLPNCQPHEFRESGKLDGGRVDGTRYLLTIDGVRAECRRATAAWKRGVMTMSLVCPHVRDANGETKPSNAAALARRVGAHLWDVTLTKGNYRQVELPTGPKKKRIQAEGFPT
jgi:hypothetical protein